MTSEPVPAADTERCPHCVQLVDALTKLARTIPSKHSSYSQGQADGLLMAVSMIETMPHHFDGGGADD